MSTVRFEEVTKRFGEVYAVDRVDLAIEPGEIFGLLGPNGAGKSTAINLILGILSPTSGRLFVLDEEIARASLDAKRNIGVVPQELAIYEDLTTIENVKFFASLYGLSGRALTKAAEQALEFTGLADRAKAAPKSFSGGMKRRLNIACAIAHRPKLIIMDEPTVGIDPQTRNHILQSVKLLNSQGCTIIYTSHYMEEVEAICTRIAIMDHGKIIAEGTTGELESLVTDTNVVSVSVSDFAERLDRAALSAIPGVVSVEIEDHTVKIASTREVNNLDRIIVYFTGNGIPIKAVESRKPDLESVFLSLTGRSLRD